MQQLEEKENDPVIVETLYTWTAKDSSTNEKVKYQLKKNGNVYLNENLIKQIALKPPMIIQKDTEVYKDEQWHWMIQNSESRDTLVSDSSVFDIALIEDHFNYYNLGFNTTPDIANEEKDVLQKELEQRQDSINVKCHSTWFIRKLELYLRDNKPHKAESFFETFRHKFAFDRESELQSMLRTYCENGNLSALRFWLAHCPHLDITDILQTALSQKNTPIIAALTAYQKTPQTKREQDLAKRFGKLQSQSEMFVEFLQETLKVHSMRPNNANDVMSALSQTMVKLIAQSKPVLNELLFLCLWFEAQCNSDQPSVLKNAVVAKITETLQSNTFGEDTSEWLYLKEFILASECMLMKHVQTDEAKYEHAQLEAPEISNRRLITAKSLSENKLDYEISYIKVEPEPTQIKEKQVQVKKSDGTALLIDVANRIALEKCKVPRVQVDSGIWTNYKELSEFTYANPLCKADAAESSSNADSSDLQDLYLQWNGITATTMTTTTATATIGTTTATNVSVDGRYVPRNDSWLTARNTYYYNMYLSQLLMRAHNVSDSFRSKMIQFVKTGIHGYGNPKASLQFIPIKSLEYLQARVHEQQQQQNTMHPFPTGMHLVDIVYCSLTYAGPSECLNGLQSFVRFVEDDAEEKKTNSSIRLKIFQVQNGFTTE
ncbi:hypothetical protein RFI_15827, partial [Reticulomyxa filosa]